jgi:hypothetical protein
MRSLRIGTVAMALAALALAAVPASAERGERRNPNRGGGSSAVAQPRGERRGPENRQDSRPSSGSAYRAPRQEAPRQANRAPAPAPRYAPPRQDNRAPAPAPRYDSPRQDNRASAPAPRDEGRSRAYARGGSSDGSSRAYETRRYDNGRYAVPRVGPPPARYDKHDSRYGNHYRYDYGHRGYGHYRYRGHYPYYYRPYTRLYWGHPYGYRPYGYGHGWSFNLYFGRPYGVYSPSPYYGYYAIPSGFAYGSLRILDAPRDAQVFVDGYYAGIVDDYDGVFQRLNLEPGRHRIEIVVPGYPNEVFEIDILPGQTITYRSNAY